MSRAPALFTMVLALVAVVAPNSHAADHEWQWSSKVDPFKSRPDIMLWLTNDERQRLRMWCGPMSDGQYGGLLSVFFPHRICATDGTVAVRAKIASEIVGLDGHCHDGTAVAMMGEFGSRLFDLAGELPVWAFEIVSEGRRYVAQFSASSSSASRMAGLSAMLACSEEFLKDARARDGSGKGAQ